MVLEAASGSDYPWAASLGLMQDLRSAPGQVAAKIWWTADLQCPGGEPRACTYMMYVHRSDAYVHVQVYTLASTSVYVF